MFPTISQVLGTPVILFCICICGFGMLTYSVLERRFRVAGALVVVCIVFAGAYSSVNNTLQEYDIAKTIYADPAYTKPQTMAEAARALNFWGLDGTLPDSGPKGSGNNALRYSPQAILGWGLSALKENSGGCNGTLEATIALTFFDVANRTMSPGPSIRIAAIFVDGETKQFDLGEGEVLYVTFQDNRECEKEHYTYRVR